MPHFYPLAKTLVVDTYMYYTFYIINFVIKTVYCGDIHNMNMYVHMLRLHKNTRDIFAWYN